MTITEAIRQKERRTKGGRNVKNQLLREADQLGIEALKAIKSCRYLPLPIPLNQLPGETL
jgi:hypothetical protein